MIVAVIFVAMIEVGAAPKVVTVVAVAALHVSAASAFGDDAAVTWHVS
jgi:hypothetical protein